MWVFFAVTVVSQSASAAIIFTTSESEWLAAAGGPGAVSLVDFGTIAPGSIVTDQFAGLGVLFTDGDDIRLNASGGGVPSFPVLVSGTDFPDPPPTDITIVFDRAQRSIALSYVLTNQPLVFFLGDQEVGTFIVPQLQLPKYIGLLSDQAFDRIVYSHHSGGNYTYLANFQFSSVPTPGAVGLLALAAIATRRRRA